MWEQLEINVFVHNIIVEGVMHKLLKFIVRVLKFTSNTIKMELNNFPAIPLH